MIKYLNKIFRSDFNKNVLILSGGTAFSQVILVAISPILTRLYTTESFGIFAIFLSIVAILGGNINLKYEQAILLPKEEKDAYKLAYISNYLNLLFSVLILLCIILFYNSIASFINLQPNQAYWLYFVPFATYFIGFNAVLVNLNNRMKNYKSMSTSVIVKNGAMGGIQLILGLLKCCLNSGLIIGQLVAYLSGNSILRINVTFSFKKMIRYKIKDFKSIMKRYKDFPCFAFPAGLANATTLNLNNLLISTVYSVSSVGLFSLTNRILSAPSGLISSSFSQVYYQKASEEALLMGDCSIIFKATLRKLFLLSISIFIPIALLSEFAFPLLFGEEWKLSGVIAKYLTFLVGIRFITSTLSVTLNVAERQKTNLVNNIILLIANILIVVFAKSFKLEFINFIIIYSCLMGGLNLMFLYTYYKASFIRVSNR